MWTLLSFVRLLSPKDEEDPEKQLNTKKNRAVNSSTEVLQETDDGLQDETLEFPKWHFLRSSGSSSTTLDCLLGKALSRKSPSSRKDSSFKINGLQSNGPNESFRCTRFLPGLGAVELCMFFECLFAGRIGGIFAGIAFPIPGFVLMLLASYLYSLARLRINISMLSSGLCSPLLQQWCVSLFLLRERAANVAPDFESSA